MTAYLGSFFKKSERAGIISSLHLWSPNDVVYMAEAVRTRKESALSRTLLRKEGKEARAVRIPVMNMAVLNHVRWLLNRSYLRNLEVISVKMEFPLDDWLKDEKREK